MEYSAKVKHVRITPRKMSLLCDQVRDKDINEALIYLKMSPRKKTAGVLSTLIKSAAANADHKSKGAVDVDTLRIMRIFVGKGGTLKRFRPRAKGSASPILKRTCHVTVALAER